MAISDVKKHSGVLITWSLAVIAEQERIEREERDKESKSDDEREFLY